MTDTIANRPLWRLVFDKDGDVDPQTKSDVVDGIGADEVTDLVMFSHGWNNDEATATSLYARWFALLAAQLDPNRKVGFVGIRWPSELWRDEPIPDFEAAPQANAGGAAALNEQPQIPAGAPTIDPAQLQDLKDMFPTGTAQLDAIADLLAQPPTAEGAAQLFTTMRDFSAATASGFNDGEADASTEPGMLDPQRAPTDVFTKFGDGLADAGVDFGGGGGAAGLDEFGAKLWNGAKEALRQLTYWQMKNRAGVVGEKGLGPLIGQLVDAFPQLRIHLIGHSFGARLVSFALAGLPDAQPSPVKAVTLLEGAFSRFAFTDALPFRPGAGALAGKLAHIDGPMSICYSSHDRALGTFYPLAAAAAGDDAAAVADPLARWRAMGSDGAYNVESQILGLTGTAYPFKPGTILNLDSSDVVTQGNSPSGAHSDIFYPQLAWVAAAAGGLNTH
ncbi:MAG: hypothetical protein QOE41_4351 [Mycobacterium sp.]|jgi:hypothetical protein|nr:serine-threonine protein kinase [Mycobacterium sp.]MDT5135040.1 hypothetical protein [Mycobacterium sp.]